MNGIIQACRHALKPKTPSSFPFGARRVSTSPYGRTHVWRRRAPKLPNPVVPHFPQRVILADGSTFIHWTTSPRPEIRLQRDTTNNPIWNPWLEKGGEEGEGAVAGRMGRFRRRFEDLGGVEWGEEWVVDSMEGSKVGTQAKKQDPNSLKGGVEIKRKK